MPIDATAEGHAEGVQQRSDPDVAKGCTGAEMRNPKQRVGLT